MQNLDYTVLRNNLRGYRVRAGLTQTGLAEKLGITKQIVSRWEMHPEKIKFKTFVELANLYGIRPSDFFTE